MDNLIIPSKTRPPLPVTPKQNYPFEFSSKSVKQSLSFAQKSHHEATDVDLIHLSKNGRIGDAIRALDSMAQRGSKVKPITFINLLQSCIDSDSVELGKELHARIGFVEDVNSFVETKLVSMYAKCGRLDDARKLFAGMRERNLYVWSAMIGACSRDQRWNEVIELFYLMMRDGTLPDDFLFPKILQACSRCSDMKTGLLIHSLVIRCGMSSCLRVNNSMLAVYVKCGNLSFARRFFEKMDERDTVTWNSIISGYCQIGENDEALRMFDAMCEAGIKPGLISWNILIASYSQSGRCDAARDLMNKMESMGRVPDVFTWTSMISGFAHNNRNGQALDLFKDMLLKEVEPNGVTFVSAISACSSQKALNKGLELHSLAIKMGFMGDVLVGNSLIDLYSKCGEVDAAQQVFDRIIEKDIYSWNSMIGGYCQAGYCGKAYELFMKMQNSKVLPNVITWNVMISGYMKHGDEDQAMYLFQKMQNNSMVEPNTASWNSLIAGYLQNGEKNKALGIFRQMQSLCVQPNSVTILSVLPACGNLVSMKKVKEIHGCVLRRNLESEHSVMNSLIDTYAKSGNIEYSKAIFDRLSFKDVITWNSMLAGYVLHGFSGAALDLFDQMKKLGFKPNRGTLLSIISAYGLGGMVDEGKRVFCSIADEYQIVPAMEHYSAMVDLYGRAGRLTDAVNFIENMPIEPESSVWAALLTASRVHGNVSLAVRAGECLLDLEPGNLLIQQLLLQLYSSCGKSEATLKVRKLEKVNGTRRSVGQSWVEVQNVVHTFTAGDMSGSQLDKLYSWIHCILGKLKKIESPVVLSIEEEEKEETCRVHSEKLAIAFSLIGNFHAPQSIRIVKNLRICKECHQAAKDISVACRCEIYISDSTCFHHFKNGCCSCGDYW